MKHEKSDPLLDRLLRLLLRLFLKALPCRQSHCERQLFNIVPNTVDFLSRLYR